MWTEPRLIAGLDGPRARQVVVPCFVLRDVRRFAFHIICVGVPDTLRDVAGQEKALSCPPPRFNGDATPTGAVSLTFPFVGWIGGLISPASAVFAGNDHDPRHRVSWLPFSRLQAGFRFGEAGSPRSSAWVYMATPSAASAATPLADDPVQLDAVVVRVAQVEAPRSPRGRPRPRAGCRRAAGGAARPRSAIRVG